MLVRFAIYGVIGIFMEVVYTAGVKFYSTRDWKLEGQSYLWMFPIYGLISPLYEPLHDLIRQWPLIARATVWCIGFTGIELLTGLIIGKLIGRCPWDYSAHRFAINQYIRWDFFPLWAAVGLAVEPLHDLLVSVTAP